MNMKAKLAYNSYKTVNLNKHKNNQNSYKTTNVIQLSDHKNKRKSATLPLSYAVKYKHRNKPKNNFKTVFLNWYNGLLEKEILMKSLFVCSTLCSLVAVFFFLGQVISKYL